MTLEANLNTALTAVGTEFKTVKTYVSGSGTGNVSGLNTTATNLVAAVNEVKITADAAAGGGVAINDAATNLTEAWSSSKIDGEIAAGVAGLVGGAPGALDTLNELAAAMADDAAFSTTITNSLALKQAAADIGNPNADFAATFAAALT